MIDTLERVVPRGYSFDPSCVLYLPLHKMEFGRSANLLTKYDFETGDPPTGWSVEGTGATWVQSTEQVHGGTYSGKLTRAGTNCAAHQDHADYAKYKGLQATMYAWVHASVAAQASLYINDGVASTYGATHTGGGAFELLTVTRTLSSVATNLRGGLLVVDNNTPVYIDDAELYINNLAASRDHYGHLVQKTGALWRPDGHYFDGGGAADDFIEVKTHSALDALVAATIIMWVKIDDIPADQRFLNLYKTNTDRIELRLVTDTGNFEVNNDVADSGSVLGSGITIVESAMTQIALTISSAGLWSTFVNGVPGATNNEGVNIGDLANGFRTIVGGVLWSEVLNKVLDGTVKIVSIYNRVMALPEIQRDYLANK